VDLMVENFQLLGRIAAVQDDAGEQRDGEGAA
jgi:hypothetical protein